MRLALGLAAALLAAGCGSDDSSPTSTGPGTVAFRVQPHWSSIDPFTRSLLRLEAGGGRAQIFKNGVYLRALVQPADGGEVNLASALVEPQWEPGEWHHVALTWNGSSLRFYLDGQHAVAAAYSGALPTATEFESGSEHPDGEPSADAEFDSFLYADRALEAEEIAALAAP